MKHLVAAFFAMGCGLAATAQTSTPAMPPPTSTHAAAVPMGEPPAATGAPAAAPESTSTTMPDDARYRADPRILGPCETRVAAMNNKQCDIIFIGDSITEDWLTDGKAIWNGEYAPHHALNFGVGGDKTQNVLWRLNNMDIQSLKPRVAVLLIGTNNLDNTPHEIADGVQAVLANTQAAFAGVKIVLVSIMPNERANEKMMQVNSIIRSYNDNENVYFLNLVPLMPAITITNDSGNPDASWKGLGKDRLHPDESGYKIWADAMDPLLNRLLSQKP